MAFSFSEKRSSLSNVQIIEWYYMYKHLEADKPGLLAKLEEKWGEGKHKGNSREEQCSVLA